MYIKHPAAFGLSLAAIICSAIGILPTFYGIIFHLLGAVCVTVLYFIITGKIK